MRYQSFRIRGYKGIINDIVIDLEKTSLIPIIGINECGKTTILEAIFSFDRFNDQVNNGRHLLNIENMYSTVDNEVKIEAKALFYQDEFLETLDTIEKNYNNRLKEKLSESARQSLSLNLNSLTEYKTYFQEKSFSENSTPLQLYIGRDLKTKRYYFLKEEPLTNDDLNHDILYEIMRILPYTVYFDDFRDRIDEKLEINTEGDLSPWLEVIDRLFQFTDSNYSVFDLPKKNENIRRSIIAEVEIKLNEELLKEWPNFSLQHSQPLQIKIHYSVLGEKHYLEFLVVEKIIINGQDKERYFKIHDRSKGFFWYFNFIMKLIFNSKRRNLEDNDTIYLLDEPGSYLHSTAQFRLTKRLKDISKKNKIIYCTHSPYLLDPNIIPINSIRIVEKNAEGNIEMKTAFETKAKINKKNSAYQPIYDALDVRPVLLDYDINNIVLVEGMYDYLSFEMFKGDSALSFFPCINADSILNNISYMIFLKKNYIALWDNDKEGIEQMKKAEKYFGDIEANRFLLLPMLAGKTKSRLENFYDIEEVNKYKAIMTLPKNQSFEKTIMHIFYSEKRDANIMKHFPTTQLNFIAALSFIESKFDNLKQTIL